MYYDRQFAGTHLMMLGIIVLIAWASTRERLSWVLLFASIFFNHIGFEYQGLNVRLDYIVCAILILAHVGGSVELWRTRAAKYMSLLLVTFVLSSLTFAPAVGYSLRKLAIVAIYAMTAAVLLSPRVHGVDEQRLVRTLLAVGNLVLLVSLIGFLLFRMGINVGVVKDRETAWLRGPMLNPNVFGSTAAVIGLMNLGRLLGDERAGVAKWLAFLVSVGCVFLSYTRAAWLLFALGVGVMLLRPVLAARGFRVAHLAMVVLVVIGWVYLDRIAAALRFEEKLAGLLEFQSGTGLVRLMILQQGIRDWLASPILGGGFQSFDFVWGADQDPTAYSQMILTIQLLQYGGIVALFWFASFVFRIHREALAAIRNVKAGDHSLGVMLFAFDLLLLAYQVTSAIVLPFFWFYSFLLVYLADQHAPKRLVSAAGDMLRPST